MELAKVNMRKSDLAVSESLGYILIFGTVMACIAILFVTGSQIISENQKSASFKSMAQNFNVIQSDLVSTASGSSPVMTAKISINDGVLNLLPDTEGNNKVVVTFNGPPTEIPLGKLVYETSDKSIALEDGAIITLYGLDGATGSIMSQQPKIYYSPTMGRLMIGTIVLQGDHTGISSSFVPLQFTSDGTPTPQVETSLALHGEPVVLYVKTNYSGAWMDFLTNIPGLKADVDNTVDPAQGIRVTLHDANHMRDPLDPQYSLDDIRSVVIVQYNIGAKLG